MPIIYEYETDGGDTVRIQATPAAPAVPMRGGYRGETDDKSVVKKVQLRFEQALGTVKAAADGLKKVMDQVNPDEVAVEFSIAAEGEAGFFTICRAATSAEFKITLSWKNGKKNE